VSIDDGGPVLEAETDTLPAVAGSRQWRLAEPDAAAAQGAMHWVLAAPAGQPARAARVPALVRGDQLLLTPAAARLLQPAPGALLRAWPAQGT
jgi:arginine/ornithine N-succinyltransferase beta subunit